MSLPGKRSIYEHAVMVLTLLAALGFVVEGCTKKKDGKGPDVQGEATPNLQKIFDGAKAYFEKGAVVTRRGEVIPLQFPAGVQLTPTVPCKGQPGDRCHSTSWRDATWLALGFEISDPHTFRYDFVSSGEGTAASFTVQAVAWDKSKKDYVVVEREGTVDPQMRVVGSAKPDIRRIKSLDELTKAYTTVDHELDSCKKYKGVQLLDPQKGTPSWRGNKPAFVTGKTALYCLKLWEKRCSRPIFRTKHRQSCKRAAKKLSAAAPKGDNHD